MFGIPHVLLVIIASLVISLISTALDWILVYRTERFQQLTDEIKDTEKKRTHDVAYILKFT
jgi:hypothetical protein